MALFNYASKELNLKIVYYGPGLSGKTTNLQHLHSTLPADKKGKLLSLATESDRTLFFDFLPVDMGKIRDFSIRIQLYTVPGQIRYNATRKLVLKGADAVIFVADSQREIREQNIESLENMIENLRANGIDPEDIPIVLQYNKRDLKNILSIDELNADLSRKEHQVYLSEAINGLGVEDTLQATIRLLIKDFATRYNIRMEKAESRLAPGAYESTAPEPHMKHAAEPPEAHFAGSLPEQGLDQSVMEEIMEKYALAGDRLKDPFEQPDEEENAPAGEKTADTLSAPMEKRFESMAKRLSDDLSASVSRFSAAIETASKKYEQGLIQKSQSRHEELMEALQGLSNSITELTQSRQAESKKLLSEIKNVDAEARRRHDETIRLLNGLLERKKRFWPFG